MHILGVDPGLTRCGVALIRVEGNASTNFLSKVTANNIIFCKTITTKTDENHPRRLEIIYDQLAEIYQKYEVSKTVIERPFLTNHNPNTGLGTAQVAGIAMLLAQKSSSKVLLFNPKEMKMAITGNGAAKKEQIQKALKAILKIEQLPKEADLADALALALTAVLKPNLGVRSSNEHFDAKTSSQYTNAQKLWANAIAKGKNGGRMM